MKTEETLRLEKALEERCVRKREYGAKEVTIGFKNDGHGDEIVDFMTCDSDSVIRCYELKVTLQDLRSDAKLSWYGDYNYLVVSDSLYQRNVPWGNYIPPYVGILCGAGLKSMRNAKKKPIGEDMRVLCKDSLIRTLFWKMEEYRNAQDLDAMKALRKNAEDTAQALEDYKREHDRVVWTNNDYEFYWRKNHQNDDFSVEKQAQEERRQYALRKEGQFTWIDSTCPICGAHSEEKTPYCPYCGSDLRRLGDV